MMAWVRWIAGVVIVVMIGLGANILLNSTLDEGLGMDRWQAGLADPWTTFIGFDLMTGLLVVAAWIVWRQRGERVLDTVAWVLCLIWWGNIVTALYMLVALRQSGGDPARFFMGARAGALESVWSPSLPIRLIAMAGAMGVAVFALYKIAYLGLADLPGQAYLPGFAPVVLALLLLAFPVRTAARG